MQVNWNFQKEAAFANEARQHPFEAGEVGIGFQDFVARPHLIREVLEDYRPWASQTAIQTFYEMLEWMNGTGSSLESTDCAFAYRNKVSPQRAEGRLMIIFRNQNLNLLNGPTYTLARSVVEQLTAAAPHFQSAYFDVFRLPTFFIQTLPELPDAVGRGVGEVLREGLITCIEFSVPGNTLSDTFANLDYAFKGISQALQNVNRGVTKMSSLQLRVS